MNTDREESSCPSLYLCLSVFICGFFFASMAALHTARRLMINYCIMKTALRNLHWIALLGLMLTAACAAPESNNTPANNNAAPAAEAANANTTPAQPATPLTTIPPPATSSAPPPPQPATVQPSSPTAAKPAEKADAAHVEGPKFVMVSQEKDLDFGKQPQDKTLVRPIRIKNSGTQPLNIESVSPS